VLDVEEQLSRYGEALEHDLVQVATELPVVSVHRHRRRRSTRRAAGAAEGARTYLVEPEAHQMVALARPHTQRRRAIAVLVAVAAVIVAAVAVAVTRPGAHRQSEPAAPAHPRQVVGPPLPTTVAQPQLFWEDGDGIGRANLDGTGITRNLIPVGEQTSCGTVAADRNYVYWTVGLASSPWAGGGVARARRDGTGVDQSFITLTPYVPQCVAVGGGHVYWTGIMDAGTNSAQWTIGRANLDGTGVQESLISGIDYAQCLAVDGAHVYWLDSSGAIGRANLDGTGVNKAFISLGSGPLAEGCGLVLDGAHIYWAALGGIGRANLDGTGVNEVFIAAPVPDSGVSICAQDGTYLYWISTRSGSPGGFSGSTGSIGRALLDGTGGVEDDFITGLNSPSGCAIGP
jgi:hypothetical protein